MRVDLVATQPHYLDHLSSVWLALKPDERGEVIIPPHLEALAVARGVTPGDTEDDRRHAVALTAGWVDAANAGMGRKTVALMEHGVGQSYQGTNHPSYAGGKGRDGVVFLCPNEQAAQANRQANPQAHVEVVGSPYLDWLDEYRQDTTVPFVFDAVTSFHFDAAEGVCVEAGTTRRYWWPTITRLALPYSIAGHAHPRDVDEARDLYTAAGIPFLHAFEQVTAMTKVYVCDNSSTLFYAAALGIPVVLLNAPSYRREVRHGLRFWEYADIGWQVNDPDDLRPAVVAALEHPDRHAPRVADMCAALFPYRGQGARRAADALRAIA